MRLDPGFIGIASQAVIKNVVLEHGIEANSRLQFIVSSFFRTRTLHFMYAFSRNDFKMGRTFRRKMVQDISAVSFLMLPWLVLNIFDSFLCRLMYTRYCPKCGWKFYKAGRNGEHDQRECEYNREYSQVLASILQGSIMRDEEGFRRLGLMKRNAGRRSAYWDLCTSGKFFTSILDLACIWFSICLWIILAVALAFPSVIRGVYMLEV